MHPTQFSKIVENRLSSCHNVLAVKGAEYSRGNDRLHNFKSAANMDGTSPARSLWGMWKKHLVSIKDMIDDIDAGKIPSQDMVREKLGDNINYTLLLEGLIEEERGQVEEIVAELHAHEVKLETERTKESRQLDASNQEPWEAATPDPEPENVCRRRDSW